MYHVPRNKLFKALEPLNRGGESRNACATVAQLSSPWASFPSPGKWVADSADPPLVWGGEETGNLPASCCARLLTSTLNYTAAASGKKRKRPAMGLLPFLPIYLLNFLPISFHLSFLSPRSSLPPLLIFLPFLPNLPTFPSSSSFYRSSFFLISFLFFFYL